MFVEITESNDSSANRGDELTVISGKEMMWREAANDYILRFCGHCNTTTDIKEANFFGRYYIIKFIYFICRYSH